MTDIKTLVERLRTDAIFDNTTLGNEAADAIEALQGEKERLDRDTADLALLADQYKAERDALQARLDELQRQEPVGFVAPHDMKTLREGYPATVVMLSGAKRTVPLYAAPKALEPLTDEEIERIYQRYGGDMVNCTRAIERHHGITKGTPT